MEQTFLRDKMCGASGYRLKVREETDKKLRATYLDDLSTNQDILFFQRLELRRTIIFLGQPRDTISLSKYFSGS